MNLAALSAALAAGDEAGSAGTCDVFVSAGRRGLEAELARADLVRVTGAVVARIAR